MKNAVLALVVLLTVACGAYRFPTGNQPGTGSVTGTIVAVPCSPVESAGSTCAGRPVANLEIDFVAGDATNATTTDSNGQFRIDLPAATYKVALKPPMRVIKGPASVDVQSGSTLVADYLVDSG
ncbi:MAG: hypothetical protein ACHQ0J_13065, partial [Candidatus Dormibacterales bacterium]